MNPLARWQGKIVLAWLLTLATVSACGQTILTNADLTAFFKALAAGGTVTLDFDGTITVTNCLAITNSVVVDGSGHEVTISGGTNNEIFAVATNASLVLQTLKIANGLSTNASPGAITNDGVLSIYNCIFSNNISQPTMNDNFSAGFAQHIVNAPGGAIFNEGQLNASNSIFIQNSAIGANGNSYDLYSVPGVGGAIYNVGTAVVADCTFSGNSAVGGQGSFNYDGTSGGGDAQGGAIFNNGILVVTNSTFLLNQSSGGTGGEGVPGEFEASGTGALGGDGCGGALYCAGGRAIVINSTFLSNWAVGGNGGSGGIGEDFGAPGQDWNGGTGGNGGNGGGGAVWVLNDSLFVTNVTFATNTSSVGPAGTGGAGYFPWGSKGANGTAGLAFGATVANIGGTFSALNTIFCVQSGSTNFYGPVIDLGYNLASDQGSSLTNTTSLNGVNPMLGTLGYYGGNTQTIPLLLGSLAINAGDPLAFPPVDQRGRPRPSGPAPDIGAFEYTFPTLGNLSVNDSGAQLGLLGEVGDTCVIDVSSNLLDWTALTTNSLGATNVIEILDATTPSANRYYRARLK